MVRWFKKRSRRKALIKELHDLTDHHLADLGIHRSNIESFAMRAVDD